nr:Protein kinase C and casein kinase substrate in neurons protein [Ipomoea batatas]GMD83611.1 Protein kinase C and casein kinase substrate in neurons protein [Ipomoea batatas]
MTPTLTSQGMVLATAMAVSGTMILLVFRLQKSVQQFSAVIDPIHQSSPPLPRSCISSGNLAILKPNHLGELDKKPSHA